MESFRFGVPIIFKMIEIWRPEQEDPLVAGRTKCGVSSSNWRLKVWRKIFYGELVMIHFQEKPICVHVRLFRTLYVLSVNKSQNLFFMSYGNAPRLVMYGVQGALLFIRVVAKARLLCELLKRCTRNVIGVSSVCLSVLLGVFGFGGMAVSIIVAHIC
jgi:hypothetical protein